MFVDELTPIFREFTQHPVSFLGGLCSGLLRLNLNDDPVRSWLQQQGGSVPSSSTLNQHNNGRSSGPQSISIE